MQPHLDRGSLGGGRGGRAVCLPRTSRATQSRSARLIAHRCGHCAPSSHLHLLLHSVRVHVHLTCSTACRMRTVHVPCVHAGERRVRPTAARSLRRGRGLFPRRPRLGRAGGCGQRQPEHHGGRERGARPEHRSNRARHYVPRKGGAAQPCVVPPNTTTPREPPLCRVCLRRTSRRPGQPSTAWGATSCAWASRALAPPPNS